MPFSFLFFFFSSRRRHTRSLCDWSSDVCSSDLPIERSDSRHAWHLYILRLNLECLQFDRAKFIEELRLRGIGTDRKSTRLNSSHTVSSYAVFCWKKKTTESRRGFRAAYSASKRS